MSRDPADARLEELAQYLPDYLSIVDEELRVLFTNYQPRYEGHPSREEVLALRSDTWFPEPERERLLREVEALFAGGPPVQFESISPDAGPHWTTRIVRYPDHQGQKRALMVTTDITAQVNARRELEESQRRLAALLAGKAEVMRAHGMMTLGRLAGGVAHDFNNLIMVIQTHVDFAREEQAEGRPCLEELTDIAAATERAASLTRQLLSLARHEEAEPEVVTLSALLTGLRSTLLTALPSDVDLRIEQRADGRLKVDPMQLERTVLNLCLNVVDALRDDKTVQLVVDRTEIAEGDPRVELHRVDPGRYLTVSIAAPTLPARSAERAASAPGLGWIVVQGLVQGQAGFAEEASSVFGFTAYWPEQEPQAGPTRTVLVAEDEEMVRTVMTRTLQMLGFRVLAAVDGVDAIERYAAYEGSIDLAVLDAVMPRQGGRETFDALREQRPELPVLFCSGYAADTLSEELLRQPRVELLHKPVARTELMGAVRRLLGDGS